MVGNQLATEHLHNHVIVDLHAQRFLITCIMSCYFLVCAGANLEVAMSSSIRIVQQMFVSKVSIIILCPLPRPRPLSSK